MSTSNGLISNRTAKCKAVPANTQVNETWLYSSFDDSEWLNAKVS